MKDHKGFVSQNIGLVHFVIKRFPTRGLDREELFQVGCVGLCKAAEGFDETLGLQFSTYAVPVIMGEIKRFIRDDTQVHISRGLKEQRIKVKYAREQFEQKYHREPTLRELSEMTDMRTEDILLAEETLRPVESLDSFVKEEEKTTRKIELLCDDKDIGQQAMNRILCEEAFQYMNQTEKRVIYMRYFENQTQTKTAEYLNMTQVQVSRMEKRLLQRIRAKWNE